MKTKFIMVGSWCILILMLLPDLIIGVFRFRWFQPYPKDLMAWVDRVVQHQGMCIVFTQWFLIITLLLGWQVFRLVRSGAKRHIILTAGIPLFLSLVVGVFDTINWAHTVRWQLGPDKLIRPLADILRPLEKNPNSCVGSANLGR